MSRLSRAHDERGTIFVLVALAMPVLLLFAALTLDVGNWYVTKRQLQNRADKGAIAAALAYGYRYPACVTNPALESDVALAARTYAGDPGVTPSFNGHAGDTATVTVNADPCTDQGASIESPGGGASTNVEVTENVPSVMGSIGSLADLYARSRVSVLQLEAATGWHPFVVADAGLLLDEGAAAQPQCVWVVFDGGEPVRLTRDATDPYLFSASAPGQDVRGPAGGLNPIDADVIIGQGTADCDDTTEQTVTYPNVGYTLAWDSGRPPLPSITQVEISGGCDGNRGFVARNGRSCTIGARARVCFQNANRPQVRFGGTLMRTAGGDTWPPDPPGPPGPPNCARLSGSVSIAPGQGETTGRVSVPIVAVNRNGQRATLPYFVSAGNDLAIGPIADFRLNVVSRSSDPTINPFTQEVELRLDPGASLTYVPDAQPLVLRGASASGNPSSGPAHCPDEPSKSLAEVLRVGCNTFVTTTTTNPVTQAACDVGDAFTCVSGTGDALGADDFAARWGGVSCENNWDDYPEIPRGDPRLIVVPVTPPGTRFPGAWHAVRYFAAFYVTGWAGDRGACGNEPQPQPLESIGDPEGTIWGHFIKFVVPPSSGTPRNDACTTEVNQTTGTGRVRACIATVVR